MGYGKHEDVDDNPYLFDFMTICNDGRLLQIFFLNKRLNQIIDIRNCGSNVVQDRTI